MLLKHRSSRAWLIAGLAVLGPGSWPKSAVAAEADVLDPINVFGTPDHAPLVSGPVSTFIVDGEAIARSGVATIDEYLQRLPMFGSQGVSQNQNDGGYGVSFVDLRNLNFNRTLVLIDGRRVVPSGITTDEAVDVANIPAALVERIEVMPYGSEPRYGADAVAGVVNIVLKHDLVGLQVSAGSAASSAGDGVGGDFAVTYGKDLGRGNVTLSGSWMQRGAIPQSDRGWARDPIDTAAFAPDGALVLTRGSAATLGGYPVFVGNASSGAVTGGYDTSLSSDLRGGLTRGSVNLEAHEQVGNSTAVFVEASYSDKASTTLLPPQILGLSATLKNPEGFVIPAANAFNPFGQAVTLERVLAEVGDQSTRSDNELVRVVAGIEGSLAGDVAWSVSLNHGQSRTTYVTQNAVNLTRALETVNADPADCPASQGCVAADYFGVGSLSQAAAAYIRYTNVTESLYLENQLQVQLSRSLRVLGGAPWNLALGADYRREHGQTIPSSVVLAGDQAGPDSAPTAGGYAERELYMNAAMPLLEGRLAKSLRADLSARYVSTDLFGDFTVWKLDGEWALGDLARFRAGFGTARRVPAITEAFGGSTASPLDVADPCDPAAGLLTNPIVAANCRAVGLNAGFRQDSALINVDNGGNPHLKPEASRNLNAGIVLTPSVARGLTVSADYYRFAVHDAIDSYADFNPSYIPDTCYSSVNLSSPLCSLITRTPAGPAAGQISRILAPDENIGVIDTDGVDLGFGFQTGLGVLGALRLDWYSTVLLDYRVQETPGGAFVQEAGTFPNVSSGGSLTRFRSFLSAADECGPWKLGWTVRFIGGASVFGQNPATPFSRAPGLFYHDVSVTRRIGAVTIDFGIDNLANQRPPTLIDGVTNTNTNTYDVVGRSLHVHGEGRF